MPCNRGDVVLVLYPHTDLRTAKKRPALVVQSDNVETGLPQRIVAMVTSNVERTGPTRIHVRRESQDGKAMGILTDSVIVADNLATVLDRDIDKRIGRCPVMLAVDQALRTALAL
jgi:mRNA interferase MazF